MLIAEEEKNRQNGNNHTSMNRHCLHPVKKLLEPVSGNLKADRTARVGVGLALPAPKPPEGDVE